MLRICVLVVLLGIANGGLLGSERCTWGPSYWCENFKQAAECGATEHCHKNVWSKLSKPAVVDEGDACTFCKDIVSDVKNFLDNSETQATVSDYLKKACNLLPIQEAVQKCLELEQKYMNEFEKCIQDDIDPDAICKLCRLCSADGQTPPKDLIKAQPIQPVQMTHVSLKSSALSLLVKDTPLCGACKSFVDLAKKDVNDPAIQKQITDMAEAACKKMGGAKELECEAAVDMALPQVFKFVAQELTDQLCVSASLCTSSIMSATEAAADMKKRLRATIYSDTVRDSIQSAANGLEADACDTCEMIAGYAKIFLSNNETEMELQNFLTSNVCPKLGEFSDMCKTLVEEYVPQLYTDLLKDLDPATICKDLGLCSSAKALTVAAAPAVDEVKKETVKATVQCVFCDFVFQELENVLSKNATEEEIIQAVEEVCSIVPASVKNECDDLILQYGPKIIQLLQSLPPSTICGALGVCRSGDSKYKLPLPQAGGELCSLVSLLRESAEKPETIAGLEKVCDFLSGEAPTRLADACDTCEMIAGYAKIFLSNNETEEEIQDYLTSNVCPKLGEFSDMCKTLAEEYVPQIYADLLKNLDPATICKDLGLCSSTKALTVVAPAVVEVKKEKVKASVQCIICEFVMDKLDGILAKNATEEEIVQTVEKVCSILPSSVKTECDDLIEKYGQAIIHLIVHDASPSVICSFLGLCASGDSRYKLPLPQSEDERCKLCDTVMSYLVSILEENATKAEIIAGLEKVCNFLSGSLAGECNSAVEMYGPVIINLLADNMKPGAICTAVGLCPAKAHNMKVDGLVHLYNSQGNY